MNKKEVKTDTTGRCRMGAQVTSVDKQQINQAISRNVPIILIFSY